MLLYDTIRRRHHNETARRTKVLENNKNNKIDDATVSAAEMKRRKGGVTTPTPTGSTKNENQYEINDTENPSSWGWIFSIFKAK